MILYAILSFEQSEITSSGFRQSFDLYHRFQLPSEAFKQS